MANGEKEMKMEIQIFEYLKDEKRFLHEIKNTFKVFKGVSLGEKLKKSRHRL